MRFLGSIGEFSIVRKFRFEFGFAGLVVSFSIFFCKVGLVV